MSAHSESSKSRMVLVYSALGHFYVHFFTAIFFVVVLTLETDWSMPYYQLIELWTLGALMVGVAALPAGWLGDRLGAPVMMVIFFLGLGMSSLVAAMSDSPATMLVALTGLGCCAAIYHPVGIPWLVRHAPQGAQGRSLAFNGIFGSLGTAGAGIVTAFLIDIANWRVAFALPGLLCLATGLAMAVWVARARIEEAASPFARPVSRQVSLERKRVLGILLLTMFLGGLIYHTTQTALPKILAVRLGAGEGALGVGVAVAVIYALAGAMQLLAGWLADRYPLPLIYLLGWSLQIPLLWIAAVVSAPAFVWVAAFMVMANVSVLPAENMLLADNVPSHRHGLVFGVKFVLAFGAAPLAVQWIAYVNALTGQFVWVLGSMGLLAAVAALAALALPGRRDRRAGQAA